MKLIEKLIKEGTHFKIEINPEQSSKEIVKYLHSYGLGNPKWEGLDITGHYSSSSNIPSYRIKTIFTIKELEEIVVHEKLYTL